MFWKKTHKHVEEATPELVDEAIQTLSKKVEEAKGLPGGRRGQPNEVGIKIL